MSKNPFDKLKDLKSTDTPKQKVVPIKPKKRDSEQSYTLWLDKDLIKKLKIKAVEEESNVKLLIEQAIIDFLK